MPTARSSVLALLVVGLGSLCVLLGVAVWHWYNSPQAHTARGGDLQSKGRYHDAVREFRAAVDLQPGSAKAHATLASALMHVNDRLVPTGISLQTPPAAELQEGIAQYRQAVHLDPRDTYSRLCLAVALDNQGNHTEAIAEYRETIAGLPAIAASPVNFEEKGGLQAHVEFNQVYHDSCWLLAQDLQKLHQYPEAVKYFKLSVASKPDDNSVRMKLAEALLDSGQKISARREWTRIIQQNNQGFAPEARKMLAEYP